MNPVYGLYFNQPDAAVCGDNTSIPCCLRGMRLFSLRCNNSNHMTVYHFLSLVCSTRERNLFDTMSEMASLFRYSREDGLDALLHIQF